MASRNHPSAQKVLESLVDSAIEEELSETERLRRLDEADEDRQLVKRFPTPKAVRVGSPKEGRVGLKVEGAVMEFLVYPHEPDLFGSEPELIRLRISRPVGLVVPREGSPRASSVETVAKEWSPNAMTREEVAALVRAFLEQTGVCG